MSAGNSSERGPKAETITIPPRESSVVEFKSNFGVRVLRPKKPDPKLPYYDYDYSYDYDDDDDTDYNYSNYNDNDVYDYEKIIINRKGELIVLQHGVKINVGSVNLLIGSKYDGTQLIGKNGEININDKGQAIDQNGNIIRDKFNEPFKLLKKHAVLSNDYRPGFEDIESKDKISKTICAMANYKGGNLYIGVSDNGHAYGLNYDLHLLNPSTIETFEKTVKEYVEKSIVNLQPNDLTFNFPKVKNSGVKKQICVISIPCAKKCVYLKKDDHQKLYVRYGPSSYSLRRKEIVSYCEKFSNRKMPDSNSKIPETNPRELKEGTTVKFMQSFDTKQDPKYRSSYIIDDRIVKHICGMANTRGGTLYVGVDEKGKTSSLKQNKKLGLEYDITEQKLSTQNSNRSISQMWDEFERNIINALLKQLSLPYLLNIDILFHNINSVNYCEIKIPSSHDHVFLKDDDEILYLRKGNETIFYKKGDTSI